MKVRFFATFRDITRRKEEEVPAPDDVWELLNQLCERYGGFREKLISADGKEIHAETIILVNGRNICHLSGRGTRLTEYDVVSLFPVVAGG